MLISRAFLLASLSFLSLVHAQNPFTSPSAGDDVTVGESFEVAWNADSSYDEVGLSVCRDSGTGCVAIGTVPNTGSYDWTPASSLTSGNTYYIILTGPTGSFIGTSSVFSIQGSDDDSSTSSSSGPSSGPTSVPPSETTGPASTTSRSSSTSGAATATPQESESSNVGAIAGGAVAAVIVVIVIAIGGFFWMRKKNQKKIADLRAEFGTPSPDDDIEAGKKMKRSSMIGVAGKTDKKSNGEAYKPKDEPNGIQLAELPAVQQEPVEMMAVPGASNAPQNHFFAMELDSREIPRPGTSSVKPDVDGGVGPKHSMDKTEAARGVSIDGTTVHSETERPKTSGTIDQIKEESREGSSREQAQVQSRSETPSAAARNTIEETRPTAETHRAVNGTSRPRDSTPQIRSSIPTLPAFDFDSSRF